MYMYIEKKVSDILQPCLSPFDTGNQGEIILFTLTVLCELIYNGRIASNIRPFTPLVYTRTIKNHVGLYRKLSGSQRIPHT